MTVEELYRQIIDAWNARDAAAFSELFILDGELVGFDGTQVSGRGAIAEHLRAIWADHKTPPYVGIVQSITTVTTDVAIVRAVAGNVVENVVKPELAAVQRLTAVHRGGDWRAALFHTTPAAYHGRADDKAKLVAELTAARTTGDNAR